MLMATGTIRNGCTMEMKTEAADEESKALAWLLDAFPSLSLEQIASAYSDTNFDANKTAEILAMTLDTDTPASSSSTFSEQGNSALIILPKRKDDFLNEKRHTSKNNKRRDKNREKKNSVCTGTISSVLGNGHLRAVSSQVDKRKDTQKIQLDLMGKNHSEQEQKQEQERHVEEFLYSMMGDGWQLEMDVVRNVLSQCGYDVEKSLSRLLEMAASSSKVHYEDLSAGESSGNCSSEKDGLIETSFRALSESFPERDQEELLKACQYDLEQLKSSFPDLSESVLKEILQSVNFNFSKARNLILESGMEARYVGSEDKSGLPREFLESLFNIKKSREMIPSKMDFVKAVRVRKKSKKMPVDASLVDPPEPTESQLTDGEEDEYALLRKTASQHWGTMRSYFQEAVAAYSSGERARAGYLSAEGNRYKQLAREADEKASKRIFDVKNRDMHNDVTIDLHSQHVKEAIRLLKLHIQSLASISSIHSLKVITGCGSHGTGRGRIKRAVTQLLEKEGIEWTEENPGVIVIKIKDVNPDNLSFVNSDSDA